MRLRAAGRAETYPQSRFVSANFLDVLGARMHLGAGFIADDDLPGERRTPAVISYYLWRNYFAGDPARSRPDRHVNGKHFTVIGVLEERIDGLQRDVNLWLPLSALASIGPVTAAGIDARRSGNCCIEMMGRLADGVDVSRAKTELQLLHEQFAAASRRTSGRVEVYGTAYISGPGNSDLGLLGALACGGRPRARPGVRQRRQPAACARAGTPPGACDTALARRQPDADHPAADGGRARAGRERPARLPSGSPRCFQPSCCA